MFVIRWTFGRTFPGDIKFARQHDEQFNRLINVLYMGSDLLLLVQWNVGLNYGHLTSKVTSPLRSPLLSPK